MTRFAAPLLLLALCGCSIALGGRPEACGEYPEGGGPSVIATRDQELCEVVRLRVTHGLESLSDLSQARIDDLVERSRSWEGLDTIERLVEVLREQAGEGVANDVQRAADSVVRQSRKPLRAECAATEERCMVRGAVRGLRIALLNARPTTAPVQLGTHDVKFDH